MSFKLKDWYGNEKIYNYDKIFFRDENDELVQFTQGKGEAALESLEVTKNGSYAPAEGVDGFSQVTVNVEPVLEPFETTENGFFTPSEGADGFSQVIVNVKSEEELNEVLMYQNEITGFAANGTYGGLYTADCPSELADFEIVVGQEYVVLWDDVAYSVIAQDASSVISGAIFFGNGSGLGLSGNGEPFAIGYNPYGVMFFSADTSASHSIGIIKRVRHQDLLLQDITIIENGEYSPDAAYDGFGKVTVEVPKPEAILQDKTITENGTFTADSGFDGLGSVIVDVVASGGSDVKFVRKSVSLSGTAGTRYSVDFGFTPDLIIMYPSSNSKQNSFFIGTSGKFNEKFGSTVSAYGYASSSSFRITSSMALIDATSSGQTFYNVNSTGFSIGGVHGTGTFNVIAFGF